MLEADNVIVMQRPVDLDFRHKLLLGSGFGEGSLCYDFGGRESFCLKVCELVTLGEPTLSEEFASEVLFNAHIAIELDDLFFDDDLGALLLEVVFASGSLGFGTHAMLSFKLIKYTNNYNKA
jgi:hypothetical protein